MSKVEPRQAAHESGPSRRLFLGGIGSATALVTLGTLTDRSVANAASPATVEATPASRRLEAREAILKPSAVNSVSGSVKNAAALVNGGTAVLTVKSGGATPQIILDYGHIVGGLPKFVVSSFSGDVTLKAVYSQSLPYLLPAGDGPSGTPPTTDAAEGDIAFMGDAGGAQLSRVELYPVTCAGPIVGPLLQAGERFQAVELLGSGSVGLSVAGLLPSFRLDTPDDPRGGAFSCSDANLDQIWADGVHTANACCVPTGSVPPMWVPTAAGMKVYGCGYTGYYPGDQWTDYTFTFHGRILENELAWLVRGGPTTLFTGGGTTFVLCAGDDALPISKPGTLRVYNLATLKLIDVIKLPFRPKAKAWYNITTVVKGTSVTVTINGSTVYNNAAVAGMSAAGWPGFNNAQGAVSLVKNVHVIDGSNTVLLSEPLTNAKTATFIDQCVAGTNVYPVISDGAARDRLVWQGDIGITHQTVLYGSFDNQYIRGSSEVAGLYQTSNGLVPIAVPIQGKGIAVTGPNPPAPFNLATQDYALAWAHAIYDYWFFTDDTKWLRFMYAKYQALINGIVSQRETNGLLSGGGPLATQLSSNSHLYGVLLQAATIAKAVGDSRSAHTWKSAAPTLRSQINELLFNSAAGMYSSSTTQLGVFDQIGNGYALLFGVPDSTVDISKLTTSLTKALAGPLGPADNSADAPSGNIGPYTTGWEVLGRLEVGDAAAALRIIRSVWGAMLPQSPFYSGAHWEYIAQDGTPGLTTQTSLAHGWSSGATPALSKYVLGGRPLSPGFATWLVEPQVVDLEWASGRVPTPHGPLGIEWRTTANGLSGFTVNVQVPAGTSGFVGVPTSANTATVDGVVTARSTVPGHTPRDGYRYFGPLKDGSHQVVVKS